MTSDVVVFGAGSALGFSIVELLRARGVDVTAAFRTPQPGLEGRLADLGAVPARADLTVPRSFENIVREASAVIAVPILTRSKTLVSLLRPDQRAVFFSSQNVEIDPHAPVYEALLQAEGEILSVHPAAMIFRPTMIYGYPSDGNLAKLMQTVRNSPVIPLPGRGTSLQRPIYYRDLAQAVVSAVMDENAFSGPKSIAGPDLVSTRQLFQLTARAVDKDPVLVPLPVKLAGTLVLFAEKIGLSLPISSRQLMRATVDKDPKGDDPIFTETDLKTGLGALAKALDDQASDT